MKKIQERKGDGGRDWSNSFCASTCDVCVCRNVLLKPLYTKSSSGPFAPQRPVEVVVSAEEREEARWGV